MTSEELLVTIERMTGPELDRLRNAINVVKVNVPKPGPTGTKPGPAVSNIVSGGMVHLPSNEWILNDCRPPNSDYLDAGEIQGIERAAIAVNRQVVASHGNAYAGWEGTHGGHALDIRYFDKRGGSFRSLEPIDLRYFDAEATVRLILALTEQFPSIARPRNYSAPGEPLLPNPTVLQRISAATQDDDTPDNRHNNHMHLELAMRNGRILMHSEIRRVVLDAAGRMR